MDYVIVAFRSERHLGACLDAIEVDRPDGATVIVVDNASPDGSVDVARSHPSQPVLLASPRNLGFAGGCNLALDASSADLLFFVNPDARLARGTTAKLIATIEADSAIAVVGPRIYDPGGVLRAASAGFEPSMRSILGHFLLLGRIPGIRRFFQPLQLSAGSPAQAVDWVSGAALMVRSDAFRSVSGFDASMFMYMEDVDLCRRLRASGRTIRYEPGVAVEHDLGGSQGADQAQRWFAGFHRYVARLHGEEYARLASAVAAIGLGLRAVPLMVRRPVHGRRLARAAWAAAGMAVGTHAPSGASLEA